MHKLYTFKGFVLDSNGIGEKNMFVSIFSEGLGLVRAKAISSRDSKGKLKGHIVPYSYGSYTFVRGKDVWRLIQADSAGNLLSEADSLLKKRIVARICQLIKKMAGEEPELTLFKSVSKAFDALSKVEPENLKAFEALLVSRVLFALGYMSFDDLPEIFKELENFSPEAVNLMKENLKEMVLRINDGLRGSHLTKQV